MTTEGTLVEAVRETMKQEMNRDERIIVYGEDVGIDGGVFRATEGLVDEFPDRVYDSPLAEAGIVGAGVGLAAYGLKPIPEIQFSGFLYQAFHQIKQHAARIRSRSRGSYSCQMTIRAPYGGGIRALEHHSESFEAGYAHVPGIKVVAPSSPAETKGLLTSAIRDPDPVLFLEPKRIYRSVREEVPDGEYRIPIGEANVVRTGDDLTVVSWGAMLRDTRRAIEELDADVELVDLRSISPIDTATVTASVKKTGRCVIVHESSRTGGLAGELIARINEDALLYLEAPIERITGFDVPYPLFEREETYVPSTERIRDGVQRTLEF